MHLLSKSTGVLLAIVLCLSLQNVQSTSNFKTFVDNSDTKFNHMVLDKDRGWVFIGAVNRLYQLSLNLELISNYSTGPVDDALLCSVLDCPLSAIKKPTNNYNKALVIDYSNPRLIACGSVFQGLCTVHNLMNISDVQVVKESVVANNASASTVAFIAPGPVKSTSPTFVLYVGATFTGNSPYRSEVPAVASRSLENNKLLSIAEVGVTTGTRMFVNNLSRERYIINYVYGFSSGAFSYFLTTQMKMTSPNSPYISKLIRICHEDKDYYSYTEIPIECIGGGRQYNLAQAAFVGKPGSELAAILGNTAQDDVLYVVFSQSEQTEGEHANQPTANCALCIYSLNAIKRQFKLNINNCFSGKGTRGLDFIIIGHDCIRTKIETITEDFCGLDVNTPLGGEIPVTAVPVLTFNTNLSAVAATSTGDFTVVFIGTRSGHLKKIVVENSVSAFEYDDIVIDEKSSVNADMMFDTNMNYLYVMTENKVTRVKVQNCSKYESCKECLSAKDPYCGWCSLENKCSLRSSCQDAAKDPLSWIPYKTGRCTSITSVSPKELQRTTARTLELTIDNLPPLAGQFLCVFTIFDKVLTTNATRNNFGVNCTTPRTDLLPSIPPGQHHFTAKLSVKTSNNPEFVVTNFTFFDCNTYTSCTPCVSSMFPCDWCVDGHRCTHDTAENCRNDILVTGINRGGPSYRSGPTFCPTINGTTDGSSEILVPAGTWKGIRVKIHIIGQFIVQTRFLCQFNIEGRVSSVNADLIGDTISCEEMEFAYTQRGPNMTATFAVIWGGSKPLDNPDDIHVVIYRCRDMAENCGMCLALDKKYGCGWCQSTNRCEITNQCDGGSGGWLNQSHTCPNLSILSFRPQLGPWEGGTNITIEGINLGRSFSDIYSGVTVAGISCEPYEHLYKTTREIVCRVDGPGTSEVRKGPVMVKVENFRGESKQHYQFIDPRIEEIFPRHGPRSGGTTLSIKGKYMNAGSLIEVFIDELPCKVISVNASETKCLTSASNRQREGKIKVKFDQGIRFCDKDLYEYTEDPIIESLESGVTGTNKFPKGIPAGGIKISVSGKHLLSIQRPKFYVYNEEKTKHYLSKCEVHSDSLMTCLSPYIADINNSLLEAEKPKQLDYGFEMDNVAAVQNISMNNNYPKFSLYPNPHFDEFENMIKYYKSDYLTINGMNIDRACQETDIRVRIGNKDCNVTSLSKQQLTCKPPSEQPTNSINGSDSETNNQDLPEVIVSIGENFHVNIGKLDYSTSSAQTGAFAETTLYGGVVGMIILTLIFIAFLIAYRRKSTESSRVLKNMQEQMDILELRVAAECKEAFAELQTEMTDLTSDITSGGIPFLDYRSYAIKILFPNLEDHSAIQREKPELLRKEKGLRLFGQLVLNKTFLLLFIRTLESNRYFSMKDRVNVAAMIMISLQSKMEYCTDILKTLLADLIEKCIEGKSHPKLLLRRTESVAEKMLSAWFTFLLYKFLRECAGEPLYMLFRAIKQQVNKGPVDAITSEARYSLSEEKLIRQSIDYRAMTVYVSISQQTAFVTGLDPNTENVPVKVLDCDTISQVKEKALDTIYRATPYSQRPRPSELDVEWRTGMSGRLILYDDDSTSKIDNEWKKKNTLNHYRVPDGGLLNLVSVKQTSNYNLSIMSADKIEKLHKYETLNIAKYNTASPPYRTTSPLTHDNDGGYKAWHLVKHHDSNDNHKEGDRSNKMVSEIYLTRLLATKGTLQKFVDDLFETIFSTAHRGSALPLAIKYMFDFLDDQALQHGITDPEVVHTWKSNSLPLRFWVNLIKNPNFVFDIHKSNIVDSCLSVVAQTFMDSCSTSDHRLGKDSPSSKLLYAKDIPVYKEWVDRYYSDIKIMQAISDQDMNAMLAEESRLHATEFNINSSLYELYMYAVKYNEQLMVTLEEDEFSQKQRLAYKLEQVHNIMVADPNL
ncbi:hypothetical protein PGB90_001514 [Kerria lacca]